GGEAALAAARPGESSPDCRDVASVPPEAANAPETLLVDACAGCHSSGARGFFERVTEGEVTRRVWKPELLGTQAGGPPRRYGHIAELYDKLYCKVFSDSMPMGGWDVSDGVSAEAKKKKALCFFGGKRNEAARASEDPAVRVLDSALCQGQAVP